MRQHHFSIFRPGTRIRMEIITGTRNLIRSIGIGETLNSSDVLWMIESLSDNPSSGMLGYLTRSQPPRKAQTSDWYRELNIMNRQMNKGNTGCATKLSFLRIVPRAAPAGVLLGNCRVVRCTCPNPPSSCPPLLHKPVFPVRGYYRNRLSRMSSACWTN